MSKLGRPYGMAGIARQNAFHDRMRSDLAFRYWREIGAGDDLVMVASYMKVGIEKVEDWRSHHNWNQKLFDLMNGEPEKPLEQVLRNEVLKNLGLISRGVEQYLMTMFKRDEATGDFLVDEYNELILVDYLKIGNSKDLTAAIQAYKAVVDMKLNVMGGIITKTEKISLEQILITRDDEEWDVYRTMRECEIVLGKIPEFLRIEAQTKRVVTEEDHGDVEIVINLPKMPEEDGPGTKQLSAEEVDQLPVDEPPIPIRRGSRPPN